MSDLNETLNHRAVGQAYMEKLIVCEVKDSK